MAAETAYDSWGPRYAPTDPTLPEPWTALIDTSTGLIYYWNLETNITQYEKPTAVLPLGQHLGPYAFEPVSAPQMFTSPEQIMPPQQGYNTPQSYKGVNMGQSQSYQFTPHQPMHYTGYQQWPHQQFPQNQDNCIQKQPTRYGDSRLNMQQSSPFGQLQHKGVDYQQYGLKFQTQKPNISPVGSKMGFKDSPPFNAKNGGFSLVPHQPKIAPVSMPKTNPKVNSDKLVHQNVSPTLPSGPVSENMNNALMRANPTVVASPDAMTQSSIDIFPKIHDVTAKDDNVPAPFMSFESTGFPPEILNEIYAADLGSPSPIQAKTWRIALQNRDIVAIAKTDSGKTLGYLIPAFMLLRRCNNNRQHGPTVVVLSPTRELAIQIQDDAVKFGRSVKISCSCLYGEAPNGPQLKDLERGADIIVATPGRLNDIIEMRKIQFGQVSLLVLDEADRMLDMGFEPQIRKIVNEIPPRRQTLMYTATWPEQVRKIASDLLVNPFQVNIDNADELAANKSVTQDCTHAPDLVKVEGANQLVPHKVREITTHGGGPNRNDRGRSYSRSRSRTPVRRGRSRSWSRSYSRSRTPVRRGRSRSRSRSPRRSRSRSWSRTRSYSRSRSWSRSRSPKRSRSRSWTPVRRESNC